MKLNDIAVAVCASFMCCAVVSAEKTSVLKEFPAGGVGSVKFMGVNAPVSLETSTGVVRVAVTDFEAEKCEFDAVMAGSALRITLKPKKTQGWFGGTSLDCRASASVSAPASAELDIGTVSGNVSVRGFSSAVKIGGVSADAHVEGLGGPLRWSSVSGDLGGSLSGPAELSTTSGDAVLSWSAAPGKISFKSVSGSGEFALPKGSSVAAGFNSVSGRLSNSLPEGGGVSVTLKTVSGDVKLFSAR